MNVLWHHDITRNEKLKTLACAFKGGFEESACFTGIQIRETVITTEGEKVEVSGLLITDESAGHLGLG